MAVLAQWDFHQLESCSGRHSGSIRRRAAGTCRGNKPGHTPGFWEHTSCHLLSHANHNSINKLHPLKGSWKNKAQSDQNPAPSHKTYIYYQAACTPKNRNAVLCSQYTQNTSWLQSHSQLQQEMRQAQNNRPNIYWPPVPGLQHNPTHHYKDKVWSQKQSRHKTTANPQANICQFRP